ncbi:MAG: hypothetical protein JW913_16660 [Chitinispirillaceae bacterium]|nr:hypothetical protein [Chitinispirillaceae bacterium]
MKHIFRSLVGIGMILCCIGCSENPATGPGTTVTLNPETGRFGLSHLKGLNRTKDNSAVKEGENIRFDLGSIKGSTGFFFLLYNVGNTPITDITLSVANSAFSVYPASMDTLIPGSDLGMLPIVKVNAFHGTPLDGVGTRPLLPKGDNECILTVSGHTKTAAGIDTTVELQANLQLDALLMDLAISRSDGEIDLRSQSIPLPEEFADLPDAKTNFVNVYSMGCNTDTILTLLNSGNVPTHIRVFSGKISTVTQRYITEKTADTIVPPTATLQVLLPSSSSDNTALIIISGENTVSDESRLPLQDDGNCYLMFRANSYDCAEVAISLKYQAFLAEKEMNDCAKIYAFIDNHIVFYGERCGEVGSETYSLYDLTDNTLLCSQSAGSLGECIDEVYGTMLKTIIANSSNPDNKTFGLESGRVTAGGSMYWFINEQR